MVNFVNYITLLQLKIYRLNLLSKLFALVALFVTTLALSQTPSLTLTTSLGAENITCANEAFTLTVLILL